MPPERADASVSSSSRVTGSPARRLSHITRAFLADTATTRTSGRRLRSAQAMPPASPPPDRGTTTVATSGSASSTSSATVPCPAATQRSSKGGTHARPSSLAAACERASAAS